MGRTSGGSGGTTRKAWQLSSLLPSIHPRRVKGGVGDHAKARHGRVSLLPSRNSCRCSGAGRPGCCYRAVLTDNVPAEFLSKLLPESGIVDALKKVGGCTVEGALRWLGAPASWLARWLCPQRSATLPAGRQARCFAVCAEESSELSVRLPTRCRRSPPVCRLCRWRSRRSYELMKGRRRVRVVVCHLCVSRVVQRTIIHMYTAALRDRHAAQLPRGAATCRPLFKNPALARTRPRCVHKRCTVLYVI